MTDCIKLACKTSRKDHHACYECGIEFKCEDYNYTDSEDKNVFCQCLNEIVLCPCDACTLSKKPYCLIHLCSEECHEKAFPQSLTSDDDDDEVTFAAAFNS